MAKKRLNAIEKRIAQTMDYKRVFASEQGKRVLREMMQAHYVMQPTLSKDALQMAFREGQRTVVMRIMQILETSEETMHELIREQHNESISE